MKISSIRLRRTILAVMFVISSVILQFTNMPFASAATVTWDGSAGDNKFSTGANWSSGSVPNNGDALVFDSDILSSNAILTNDIVGLTLTGISITGTVGYIYVIDGNVLTIGGNINNTSTNTPYTDKIRTGLILSGDITVTNTDLESSTSIDTQGHSLTFGGVGCRFISSPFVGNGTVNITAESARITGTSSTFAGTYNITAGETVIKFPESLGTSAGSTNVSGTGSLGLWRQTELLYAPITEPFTFGGSGTFRTKKSVYPAVCNIADDGFSEQGHLIELAGPVTLTSDFNFFGDYTAAVTGTFNRNGHSFIKSPSSPMPIVTDGDFSGIAENNIVLSDNLPGEDYKAGFKDIVTLDGVRDNVQIAERGVLKGTGTANQIIVVYGATLNPGHSPGTITALDDLIIAGATYAPEILNTTVYDQVRVGEGSVDSDAVGLGEATLNVVLYDGWDIKLGDQFRIIDNRSNTAVNGTFNGLAEGTQFSVQDGDVTMTFSITYVGGDGNDIVITAINAGTDPTPPNTGVSQIVLGNPFVIVVLGGVTTALLIAIAIRRRLIQ